MYRSPFCHRLLCPHPAATLRLVPLSSYRRRGHLFSLHTIVRFTPYLTIRTAASVSYPTASRTSDLPHLLNLLRTDRAPPISFVVTDVVVFGAGHDG